MRDTVTLTTKPRFQALPPLSLYVHIPWCVRKCPYCDFNSHEARSTVPEREYVEALVADLERALPSIWGRPVYSVFFGGGTPSLFSGESIDAILAAVRARVPLAADAEVTLEANPGTVEAAKFRAFRAVGVNRLSLGIQSFSPRHLKAIGRIHDDAEARHAIEIARGHFDNVNLDIMYALPEQTPEEARADIAAAIGYAPQHISAYHLTIEPNTYFYRFPPQLPDDDTAAAMQEEIEAALAAAGYEHYETSAFAKPGMRSRHNLNYWLFGDYLGIGAGAHSKLSLPGRVLRQMRYKQPRRYMEMTAQGKPVQEEHEVAPHEISFEFMMNALRLTEGFPLALFEERAGLPLTTALRGLEEAERRGLVARDLTRVAPTALGRRYLNDLLQIFLPAEGGHGQEEAAHAGFATLR
ncbi:MAG: oxygen-independent coproporphyrinogen III oxidase-like protein [Betaproteobacteria bacterium]|nr:oxygen-independent coproporphyrinogen III oxidase-like protein [Betaproteobacteria bacterium]